MNRWLKFIFLAVLPGVLISCIHRDDPRVVTLCGTAGINPGGYLSLIRIDTTDYVPVDSVKPGRDGHFCFSLVPRIPGLYLLKAGGRVLAPLVIHPGDSISAAISRDSVLISGGAEAGHFDRYRQSLLVAEAVADSLGAVLSAARDQDNYSEVKRLTDAAWFDLLQKTRNRGLEFMRQHPGFLSLVLVLNSKIQQTFVFDQQGDSAALFRADSLLLSSHGSNPHVIAFHGRISGLRNAYAEERRARERIRPGMQAPSIALPGLGGERIALTHGKQKYTLVYFWSANDATSRKANLALKGLYDKYRQSGFGIYAVSLDPFAERWRAAVNLDKLWWVNVNDTMGMGSEVAKAWFVQKLPVMVLTDHQGKIVERYSSVGFLGEGLAGLYGH